MYRRIIVLNENGVPVSDVGQGRSSGNGNKALDQGQDIDDAIDRVEAKWNVSMCTVPIPGSDLDDLHPDAEPRAHACGAPPRGRSG